MPFNIFKCFLYVFAILHVKASSNLSCYQCIKNEMYGKCDREDLKQCPPVSDRCVTHISKNVQNGFILKRECGLGPCQFDDVMTNKGLGMDICDRNNEEYFCVFCCKEDGCNQSNAVVFRVSTKLLIGFTILLINIYYSFQPPYILEKYDNV
ncbi:hypothetical protein RI129_005699 [Pyrocoelia pectoralis]|uniref:Protein sleepless n=1 Tax=Pyrocoelia pectoralis TaxID=417401 RepID=A0AAN7VHR4_9COLE